MKELLAHSQRRYSASSAELLPNKIQGEEDIGRKAVNLDFRCLQTGMSNIALPDDNHAELYVNEGRVHVNNNWDDNSNDNIFLGAARNFLRSARTTLSANRERGLFYSFNDFIHPPSIRPISSTISCNCRHFLISSTFVSLARRRKRRNRLSFALTRSRCGSFSGLDI